MVALNAITGTEKWVYTLAENDTPSVRGVTYWPGDGAAPPSIVFGTRGGKLISLMRPRDLDPDLGPTLND